VPNKAELVAEFLFDLVEDLNAPRYRLPLSGPTHLVPVNLDYTEIGDDLAGCPFRLGATRRDNGTSTLRPRCVSSENSYAPTSWFATTTPPGS